MKKMKLIAIFLIVFCMFFSTKNVLAADNPRYELEEKPSEFLSGNEDWKGFSDISSYSFYTDSSLTKIACPPVYVLWTDTNYGQGTHMKTYRLSFGYSGNGDYEKLEAEDSDPSEDRVACRYTFNKTGHGKRVFSLYYDKSLDQALPNVKTNCTYQSKNNSNTKIRFSILEDGSLSNFSGEGAYAGVSLSSGTSEIFTSCKPHIKFGNIKETVPIIPTDEDTEWILQENASLPTIEAQSGFATYVLSSTSKTQIVVKDDGGLKFYENVDGKATDITSKVNVDSATSEAFNSKNVASYPTYMLYDKNSGYTFANRTKFGSNSYILLSKINQLYLENDKDLEDTCFALFGDSKSGFNSFLSNNVFRVVYIAVPIILILLTSFDFAKAVFNSDDDGIQGAFKKFGKRVVAAVLIYLVPTIIIFASSLIGGSEISECARQLQNLSSELGDE